MPEALEHPPLWVEGKDDLSAIATLLTLHGIDYDTNPWPMNYPRIFESGSVTKMLRDMEMSIRTAILKPIGFVLDADSPLQNRWEAVCGRLQQVGINPPGIPPAEGFIGYTEEYKTTVGVWLMPDNQQDGKLETFLRTLIEEKDGLIDHAVDSTGSAKKLGAKFSNPDEEKAILHAWLAWQEKPGCPFGTAIRATYFTHDSPAANAFVAWFKKLYGIDATSIASKSPT